MRGGGGRHLSHRREWIELVRRGEVSIVVVVVSEELPVETVTLRRGRVKREVDEDLVSFFSPI